MTEEVEKEDPARDEADKAKKLTPEDWREIETLWEYGLMRTKEICTKYGITPSAVTQHFAKLKKEGRPIVKGGKRSEAARLLKITPPPAPAAPKVVSEFEAKKKERIEQAREMIHASARNAVVHGNRVYQQINAGTMTWVAAAPILKALKLANQNNTMSAENLRRSLDMETEVDESSMPVLEFEDLTAEEIEAIKNKGDDDDLDGLSADLLEDDDEIIEEGKPSP